MVNPYPNSTADNTLAPLHELMSRVLITEPPPKQPLNRFLPVSGTLQPLNQRLEKYPVADFINYTLRGIGQVIFANNPVSGAIILLALFIQSPWGGWMSALGVLASTITALSLKLDRTTIRNGFFGYNGLVVGTALATFSAPEAGNGWIGWSLAAIAFSASTTVMMKTLGVWWAKTSNAPPLTLPFNLATLFCLALAHWFPQAGLALQPTTATPSPSFQWLELLTAIPLGIGQIFLADKLLVGCLILLAVAICTPMGALIALLGSSLGLLSGLFVGSAPETLYSGFWGYNAVAAAMSIGGIFYAPTARSILISAIAAVVSALVGGALSPVFQLVGLPVLTVPFCIVTIACFILLQRSLPSLVPVALHAIASPEEHLQRYQVAKAIIANFRLQLANALSHQCRFYLFDRASAATKGDLRYLFNLIDTDRNGTLSTQELSVHLHQTGQVPSEEELAYLFGCMDRDGNGAIDFEEFGELMLRHRRLMANYQDFVTYFLPIDANGDDAISLKEMNVAMASVGIGQLSAEESAYLAEQMGAHPLTWNHFIEMLLVT